MKYQIYTNKISIAFMFVILIFLGGCNTASDELNAMLGSSISTAKLTTGREVSRWQQDQGTTLGKPISAKVIITYEPLSNYTKNDVYNEIATILAKNNWSRERQSIIQSGYFRATLTQDGFLITADVLLDPKINIVSVHLETISQ